jgi:hypothetical protein
MDSLLFAFLCVATLLCVAACAAAVCLECRARALKDDLEMYQRFWRNRVDSEAKKDQRIRVLEAELRTAKSISDVYAERFGRFRSQFVGAIRERNQLRVRCEQLAKAASKNRKQTR